MIEVLIGSGLRNLGSPIEREFGGWQVLGAITDLLEREYKNQALETKSYLSGDFYRSIHRVGSTFEVLSGVGYAEVIESIGWTTQGPRFPAEKAIEAADPDIEKILIDAADRVISEIEG